MFDLLNSNITSAYAAADTVTLNNAKTYSDNKLIAIKREYTDFNTLKKPGYYKITGNCTNGPINNETVYGILLVLKFENYCIQLHSTAIYENNYIKLWFRGSTNIVTIEETVGVGESWTGWKQISSTDA